MNRAIEAYALAAGVQVLYDRPANEALRSPGVSGHHTREAALEALLRGTGLHAIFSGGDSVVLRPGLDDVAGAVKPGPPPSSGPKLSLDTLEVRGTAMIAAEDGDPLDLRLYGGLVRGAVHQALASHPAIANGRYRMTLKLWIGPSGAVERLVSVGSSGDPSRDLAIAAVVEGVVVSGPPPKGLPQPVVLVIRARPGA